MGVFGAGFRRNYVCPKDKKEITLLGTHMQGKYRQLIYLISACDKKKRPTCKSREEIGEFLRRSYFNVLALKSVVVED